MNGHRWLVALSVMVCLYHLPQLVFGTVQYDGLEVHYSSQRYLSDELHSGRLPFWTPYLFAGFPFLADLQVGAWYPLNWPFFLVGVTDHSIGLELLLHSLIACTGAYALAARLIGRPAPALAAALFYGLSGWFATHSQHVGMFDTAAWLPWLFLLVERMGEQLTARQLALAGLVGAAVALPGHFQVALYTFSGVAVWAALEALVRRSWAVAGRFALGLGAAVNWGALLSAVMVLPALELVGQSIRARLSAQQVDLGYFHPASVLTLIDPDYYGLLSGHYNGPGDSTQHYFYAGILLVPLALIGAGNRKIVRTATFLGLPFLWYALGPSAGLFRLVARLPGFASVELPMHGWFLPALGLALLGGAGVARLEGRLSRRWLLGGFAFLVVDTMAVNQLWNPLAYGRGTFDALYGDRLRAFGDHLTTAGTAVERIYGQPLAAVSYRNHPLQSRVESTYGYNPLELAGFADYASAAETNPRLVAGFAASHQLLDDGALEPLAAAERLPLAYFARSVRSVPDEDEARTALADLDPTAATVVVGALPDVQPDNAATVAVVGRGADSVSLHYRASHPGLLRLAIPWYPGWHATVGGAELPLVAVDGAFLGVVVPPGEGDLRVVYVARWFALGAAISALSLLAAALMLAFARRASSL